MNMKCDSVDWKAEFERTDAWGIMTSVDIHHCSGEIIRNAEKIREFAVKLCSHLKMKRFGETVVVHFGEDEKVAGFSMTQLIETSLISGHFANLTNTAYIDIFSCKYYDPEETADFCRKFFEGKDYRVNVILRK